MQAFEPPLVFHTQIIRKWEQWFRARPVAFVAVGKVGTTIERGSPGPACIQSLANDHWSSKKLTDLKRFAEEINKDGDFVVLRMGTSTVLGFGQIVGNYEWRDDFGDVDGWDLQHIRRVRWLWRDENSPQQFDTYALKQGDTTQKLNSGPVMDWAAQSHDSNECY